MSLTILQNPMAIVAVVLLGVSIATWVWGMARTSLRNMPPVAATLSGFFDASETRQVSYETRKLFGGSPLFLA